MGQQGRGVCALEPSKLRSPGAMKAHECALPSTKEQSSAMSPMKRSNLSSERPSHIRTSCPHPCCVLTPVLTKSPLRPHHPVLGAATWRTEPGLVGKLLHQEQFRPTNDLVICHQTLPCSSHLPHDVAPLPVGVHECKRQARHAAPRLRLDLLDEVRQLPQSCVHPRVNLRG